MTKASSSKKVTKTTTANKNSNKKAKKVSPKANSTKTKADSSQQQQQKEQPKQQQQQKQQLIPRPTDATNIVFDNDGGKDDIVALAVLLAGQAATEDASIQKTLSAVQLRERMEQIRGSGNKNVSFKNRHDIAWNRIRLCGITMLDGDCLIEPASDAMRRMLALVTPICASLDPSRDAAVPIFLSPLQPVASPFPLPWRRSSMTIDFLPILNSPRVNQYVPRTPLKNTPEQGLQALADLVMKNNSSDNNGCGVTLLATGPLSNVAHCIRKYGSSFTKRIDKIVIMGGALDVPGNVLQIHTEQKPNSNNKITDKSAEWNIFWDAPAAKEVLEVAAADANLLQDKIYLFSLDSTNSVPITEEIVRQFGDLNSHVLIPSTNNSDFNYSPCCTNIAPLAQIAGTCWAIAPWYPKETAPKYYAWDVLLAVYLLDQRVVDFKKRSVTVEARKNHPEEGKTRPVANTNNGNMYVADNVDQDLFYRVLRTSLQL